MVNKPNFLSKRFALGWTVGLAAAGWMVIAPGAALAQATKTKAPAGAAKSAPASPSGSSGAKKTPPGPVVDTPEREQILHSKQWQETIAAFEQWLSSQLIYDENEVKRTKARLHAGISKMTAAQLNWFMNDMQAKLQVLQSQQSQDAEDYLTQTFAVASPVYTQKLRQKLPDLLTSTAAQVQQRLASFAAKHTTTIQNQKIFEDGKQQQIAYNESQIKAMAEESEHALDRAQASGGGGGGGGSNHFTAARDYFPNVGNDGPFGPGTSIGFGGFGFF